MFKIVRDGFTIDVDSFRQTSQKEFDKLFGHMSDSDRVKAWDVVQASKPVKSRKDEPVTVHPKDKNAKG